MDAEPNLNPSSPSLPPRGLPPVTPPSGRFIVQLFLVPGSIVLLAVLLLMMFHNLFGGSQTPEQILRQLDSDNPDIRWRAASDLATSLERSESLSLRCDPRFAAELVSRLRRAVDEADTKKTSAKSSDKPAPEGDKQQTYVSFLTVAVARLNVPLAIPVLCDMVQAPDRTDDINFIRRRRQAILALTILGDNVQNFANLPDVHRTAILSSLEQLAGKNESPQSDWARTALYYLDEPRLKRISAGNDDVVHVDKALNRCSQADDPFARRMVAWSLRFWKGDLVEPTLKTLAHDDGHGKLEN